jgi:hypothetical protein
MSKDRVGRDRSNVYGIGVWMRWGAVYVFCFAAHVFAWLGLDWGSGYELLSRRVSLAMLLLFSSPRLGGFGAATKYVQNAVR